MTGEVNTICLLGFGEVGAILAEDLLALAQVTVVVWDTAFPEENSKPNQRFAAFGPSDRLIKAHDAASAVAQADLLICAVTASQCSGAAVTAARSLRPGAWYLDLNSVSPESKVRVSEVIEQASGSFIEAAVMAPICPARLASPILISGPCAEAFLPVAKELGFAGMTFYSNELGKASACKMCRSVVIKGTEALVTEALLAAKYYGVESEVLESLSNMIPHADWDAHALYMISRSLEHGIRRAEEMSEVVRTVRGAGVYPWMSSATEQRQHWAGTQLNDLPGEKPDLAGLLELLHTTNGKSAIEKQV